MIAEVVRECQILKIREPMRTFATNPFPGMNPWLERHWSDVNSALTLYARDVIVQALPRGLQARVEEYLSVEGPDEENDDEFPRRIVPDVTLYDTRSSGVFLSPRGVAVMEGSEPIRFPRRAEPVTLRYIKIIDSREHRQVITAIEFISPANKTPKGAIRFRKKQDFLLHGMVNLVEIDLLRQGEWVLTADEKTYPPQVALPYRICVTRSLDPDHSEAYHASYACPLPAIRIPLRYSDDDLLLPLQNLVNEAYIKGRYGDSINYDLPPEPPLADEEQQSIAAILESASDSKSG